MSVTLDASLEKIYNDLNGSVDGLFGKSTGLKTTVNNFSTLNDNLKASINSNYNGDGKESVITSLTSVNSELKTISSSLDSTLINGIIKIQSLMLKIDELKRLIETIKNDESTLNSLKSDSENNASRISSLQSTISSNETKFKTKQDEAKDLLEEIKALDKKIDTKTVVLGGTVLDISSLTPGTYTCMTFPASNGVKVKYYIYVPSNISSIENPSVHLWLHGSGERGQVNGQGMGKFIKDHTINPSGIVICPELPSGGSSYSKEYLTACKELTDSVIKTYNCDTNKVSLSGHSLGGGGVIRMCAMFPNYFSQCLCISDYADVPSLASFTGLSKEQVIQNLISTNIVLVEGKADDPDSIGYAQRLLKALKSYGTCSYQTIDGWHGLVDDNTLTKQFTANGQTYSNGLEFCLAQSRSSLA